MLALCILFAILLVEMTVACYLVGEPAGEDAPVDHLLIIVRLDEKGDERT